MMTKAKFDRNPLVIAVPHDFDLEDVAREYESYGYRVEVDFRLHHLSIADGR